MILNEWNLSRTQTYIFLMASKQFRWEKQDFFNYVIDVFFIELNIKPRKFFLNLSIFNFIYQTMHPIIYNNYYCYYYYYDYQKIYITTRLYKAKNIL